MLTLLCFAVVVGALRAQAPPANAQPLSFEVASVRRNTSGSLIVNFALEGNRYIGTNVSVKDLLTTVYAPVPRALIVGGPGWINTDRFDIVGVADGMPGYPEVVQMIRSLLIERFQLAVHSEARQGDVYDLLLARSAAELGPMLQPPTADCAVTTADNQRCPRFVLAGKMRGTAITMAELAGMLEPWTEQRIVRDRTGLTGRYDVELTWTPDRLGPLPPNAPEAVVRAREAIDPNGPALSTALREQLGLRLEARKDTVDVLVVDRVERPTDN